MEARPQGSSRSVLIVAAVAIAVLVVVTVVALVLRSPAEVEQGTPEATAQAYARAVVDGDEHDAVSYLSEALQEECTAAELRSAYLPESVRVHLVDTTSDGDTASVDLRIEEGSGALGERYDYEVTLTMRRDAGSWVITEPPWPIEYCAEVTR